ncbi:MAG: hypothetical protein P8M80_10835, partial [Pirellulaceae bacterium]|nr:hypothetical protein [Pirellulaceae bacterium]
DLSQLDQLDGLLFSLNASWENLLGMLHKVATRNAGRRSTRQKKAPAKSISGVVGLRGILWET